ncbi:MAG: hypothetical protein WDO19_32165 [Bacteroidota bacterium]
MKISMLLSLLFIISSSFAQKSLPLIKASSATALIIEGENDRYNWHLSPETKTGRSYDNKKR